MTTEVKVARRDPRGIWRFTKRTQIIVSIVLEEDHVWGVEVRRQRDGQGNT